eukprot:6555211-Prymnesium_polylepis.1
MTSTTSLTCLNPKHNVIQPDCPGPSRTIIVLVRARRRRRRCRRVCCGAVPGWRLLAQAGTTPP